MGFSHAVAGTGGHHSLIGSLALLAALILFVGISGIGCEVMIRNERKGK